MLFSYFSRSPKRSSTIRAKGRRPAKPHALVHLRLEHLEDRLAWPSTTLTSMQSFATIQAAVNAANPGDTLLADAGTYAENVTINKSLSLLGPNASINPNTGTRGAEAVVEPGLTSSYDTSSIFTVTANKVTIEGFTIQGSIASPPPPGQSAGSTLSTTGVTVYAAAGISNSSNINTGGSAPSTTDISGLTVQNTIIKEFTQVGVYGDTSDGTVSTGNTIANNRIADPAGQRPQLLWRKASSSTITSMPTLRATHHARCALGIQTGNNYLSAGAYAPSISNNSVSAYVKGVYFNLAYGSASAFTISDDTITQANSTVSPAYNVGLLIQSNQAGVQSDIQGNDVSGFLYGVEFAGNNTPNTVTVQGGTLSNNTYGVWDTNNDYFYPAAYDTTAALDGVTITNSTTAGIWIDSTSPNSSGTFDTVDTTSLAVLDGTTITGGPVGLLVDGANSLVTGNTLNNAMFSGQSGNYITLANGALSGATPSVLNATGVSFDGNGGPNNATTL